MMSNKLVSRLFFSSMLLILISGFSTLFFARPTEYKSFVFIITSYNNASYFKKNIDSVLMQDYEGPYRIIYIDDCSSDRTGDLVEAYIKSLGVEHLFTIIKNRENLKKVHNFYIAGHMCKDSEIMIDFDGDDWLAHDHVLSLLNDIYQDQNIWMTYGDYSCTNGDKSISKDIPEWVVRQNAYRDIPWCTSHMKTFYAWLFKSIERQDLMHNNDFIPIVGDQAIMLPLLELSGGHFKCIHEILYIYNNHNPLNDNKVNNHIKYYFKNIILKGRRYQPLPSEWVAC